MGRSAIYEHHIKPAGRPYPPLNIFTVRRLTAVAAVAGRSRPG